MTFHDFSPVQLTALNWWCPNSPHNNRDAIICDGTVRSGKTFCMGLSFFLWANASFHQHSFGLCGKTIDSLRRNLLQPLLPVLRSLGMSVRDKASHNALTISWGGYSNTFFLFGGFNENSGNLIQGVTLAGIFLDEIVLMPQSFVEQAIARCSVENSRLWFNCNPDGPHHWFYREWIQKSNQRNALYLHFQLSDNPSLSPKIIDRYQRMFSGVFYQRFILGQWVAAQGLIYDFFSDAFLQDPPPDSACSRWIISCDYGTVNPASFGLWGLCNSTWFRVREFYFDSRRAGFQKTDGEYVLDLQNLAGSLPISAVVVDPSAASFILALRRAGFPVIPANNDVLSGIRLTAEALKSRRIVICHGCSDAIREFALYRWQEKPNSSDAPQKIHDHAMDDIRYFVSTILANTTSSVTALSIERNPNSPRRWL